MRGEYGGLDLPWRFRKKHDQQRQHGGRSHLDSQGDTPLSGVVVGNIRVATIRNPRRNQRSNSQHKLLQCRDSASNIRMTQLSLVRRDDHDQESHTETRDQAARIQVIQTLGASLQSSAHQEDDCAGEDGQFTAQPVTAGTSETGSNEGSAGEDGDDGALLGFGGREDVLEVHGRNDARDHTEVVSKERGAERSEEADEELVPFWWKSWDGTLSVTWSSHGGGKLYTHPS